ncbi:MAG TPA: PilT/PilU family type 4a pilus ATPase [Solirubrobacteraceae bacterium]|nr:PilT/PilU family type 4a pilus ATPase [Solirubrobacteraceae bacterium]
MNPARAVTPRFDLDAALARMVDADASDLHLKAGNRPLIRVEGRLVALDEGAEPLVPSDTEDVLHALLSPHRLSEFERTNELDFAYGIRGLGRFRVNAYRQRGTVALVLRAVTREVQTIAELGLPAVVRRLAERESGLVLVTGASGSGKSTTIAAMLEHINETMPKHVVTIEDPIEYLFKDKLSSIDQREVGVDTASFGVALRQVVRQDPDVIFVGELRDAETVVAALIAADAGHLVLSTLPTADATDSVNFIMECFEPSEHVNVRGLLASTLKGVVSQRLVPTIKPGGRIAACEIMTVTERVRDALINPRGAAELAGIIAHGEIHGMQTLAQALYQATLTGEVSMRVALAHASHPHDLRLIAAADERPPAPAELAPPPAPAAHQPPPAPTGVQPSPAPDVHRPLGDRVAAPGPARASTPPPRR